MPKSEWAETIERSVIWRKQNWQIFSFLGTRRRVSPQMSSRSLVCPLGNYTYFVGAGDLEEDESHVRERLCCAITMSALTKQSQTLLQRNKGENTDQRMPQVHGHSAGLCVKLNTHHAHICLGSECVVTLDK